MDKFKVEKVGDEGYIVTSYSTQTVMPAYQPAGTYQASQTVEGDDDTPLQKEKVVGIDSGPQ